jgi:hypothetical protein
LTDIGAAMEHWYVYYKVPRAQLGEIQQRARGLIGTIAAATGVQGGLQRRVNDDGDAGGNTVTLMEVYPRIADIDTMMSAMAAGVAHSGLPPEMTGNRRIERFCEL